MTLETMLSFLAQAIFLWVAFSTLLDWMKHGDETRRDIFLVFLSLTIAILARDFQQAFPLLASGLAPVFLAALLLQPWLVLRVARYSLPVPSSARKAVLAGLVFAFASLVLLEIAPPVSMGIVIGYFLAAEGYAALLLLRGARLMSGITGQRLGMAAIGSGLLVLIFLLALASLLGNPPVPATSAAPGVLGPILQILAILSAFSYYLGFAPPRWLRRTFQLNELQGFLHQSSGQGGDRSSALELLPAASMNAVAGSGALLARWDATRSHLNAGSAGGPRWSIDLSDPEANEIEAAWKARRSCIVHLPAAVGPGLRAWAAQWNARALYLVPIIGSLKPWGLLAVAVRYPPLFPQDDLAMLDLLCEQGVLQSDHSALVEELQAANRSLEAQIEERSRSEAKFRGLLESAPDGMVILDEGRAILMVNARVERLFRYRREELLGRPISMLFPGIPDGQFRNQRLQAREDLPAQPLSPGGDLYGLRCDGTQFPVDISVNPLDTGEGLLTIIGIHDLTERERAEKKFRGLLESAPDSIIVVDEAGRIQLVNSQVEAMFGYTRRELLGQSIELLVPKRFQKKHVRHREGYYIDHPARPMGADLELFAVRKNGTEFPVEISLSPLGMEGGLLVTAAIRDVTRRKRSEEEIQRLNEDLQQRAAQLEAANQELESFSYSVSHDLRAPLRSIDGFSQAVLEDYGANLPSEGRGYLERVRAAAQRMAELIDDLLNLSRVTRASLHPRFTNLSALAQEVVDGLQEQHPERQVQVSIAPDLMVNGDPHLLRIVMENLLSNAWKFTSRRTGASIEFGQRDRTRERTFFVRDNGVGFDMAYVGKLFGVFQRLHSVSDYPGTGVGLATVQRIVKIHGGRIWAESAEGQGTTFYFTL